MPDKPKGEDQEQLDSEGYLPMDDEDLDPEAETLDVDAENAEDEQEDESADEEANDEEAEESEDSDEEAEEDEETEVPPAASIDVNALRNEIVDELSRRFETGLDGIYSKLRQSSRDTVRAEVRKAVRGQVATLEGLVKRGKMSQEDFEAEKSALMATVDDQVDEIMEKVPPPVPAAQKPAPSGNPLQNAFEEACLAYYEESGLVATDPESQEISRMRFSANTFKDAVKLYQKAVDDAVKKKTVRLGGLKKPKTKVDMGGGKGVPTRESILKELNVLLRAKGGSQEERYARTRRIDALDKKLSQLK